MAKAAVKDINELPLMLTMKDVQQVTRLAKDVAYQLPHTSGFPVIRFGRAIRIPRDAFLRWLNEQAESQAEGR